MEMERMEDLRGEVAMAEVCEVKEMKKMKMELREFVRGERK